jgi:hypothetical protein
MIQDHFELLWRCPSGHVAYVVYRPGAAVRSPDACHMCEQALVRRPSWWKMWRQTRALKRWLRENPQFDQ